MVTRDETFSVVVPHLWNVFHLEAHLMPTLLSFTLAFEIIDPSFKAVLWSALSLSTILSASVLFFYVPLCVLFKYSLIAVFLIILCSV